MTAQVARAEPMLALGLDERAEWTSVGRINTSGYRYLGGCTGALIAPDLVLTAAHCVQKAMRFGDPVHFVAGWDRGSFAAHRKSARIKVNPLYVPGERTRTMRHDIALIWLESEIDPLDLRPIPLQHGQPHSSRADLMLGYNNRRPNVLNGHKGCPGEGQNVGGVLVYKCTAVGGNSGGPVLEQTQEGWKITAVLVAKTSNPERAIAAPIDLWTLQHWRDAMR